MTTEPPQHAATTDVVTEFTVGEDATPVRVRYLETRMGQRVEFAAADGGNRLQADALALESLAWQDADSLEERLELRYEPPTPDDDADVDHEVTITNEYAHIELCRVRDGGEYLRVDAPKKRQSLLLDAEALAALTRRDHTMFSSFLETPHGPDDHH